MEECNHDNFWLFYTPKQALKQCSKSNTDRPQLPHQTKFSFQTLHIRIAHFPLSLYTFQSLSKMIFSTTAYCRSYLNSFFTQLYRQPKSTYFVLRCMIFFFKLFIVHRCMIIFSIYTVFREINIMIEPLKTHTFR